MVGKLVSQGCGSATFVIFHQHSPAHPTLIVGLNALERGDVRSCEEEEAKILVSCGSAQNLLLTIVQS